MLLFLMGGLKKCSNFDRLLFFKIEAKKET